MILDQSRADHPEGLAPAGHLLGRHPRQDPHEAPVARARRAARRPDHRGLREPGGDDPRPGDGRNAAAAAYTEAAKVANEAQAALNKKYPTRTTLEAARALYKEKAAVNGDFVAALRIIAVPAGTVGRMDDVIARYTAVQALWMKGGDAKSWAEFEELNRDLRAAIREAAGVANLVRSDLGLPLVSVD